MYPPFIPGFKHLVLLLSLTIACQFYTKAQKHIIYLHGKIIENQGPYAVDSINGFGPYKFYDILDSLRKNKFTVIGEVRKKNTDVKIYANHVKQQIDSLLARGVKASDITVIGASKGSLIAMFVSSIAKNKDLNFVFMAACHSELLQQFPELEFYGHVLSIYEKSDSSFASSCESLKDKSKHLKNYQEIEINTHLRHGFLYRPLPEWLKPATNWANGNYN